MNWSWTSQDLSWFKSVPPTVKKPWRTVTGANAFKPFPFLVYHYYSSYKHWGTQNDRFHFVRTFCLADSRMPCIYDLWSLFLSSRPHFHLWLSDWVSPISPVHHHSCDLSHPQIPLQPSGQTVSSKSSHFPSRAGLSEHRAFSLSAGSHAALWAHLAGACRNPLWLSPAADQRDSKWLLQNKCVLNSPKACCYLKKKKGYRPSPSLIMHYTLHIPLHFTPSLHLN